MRIRSNGLKNVKPRKIVSLYDGYVLFFCLLYLLKCRGTDNLILAGHVEGDAAMLEVYVYNDVEDALYVHHDILLPSLPLALGTVRSS
jgi:hypothetical protein